MVTTAHIKGDDLLTEKMSVVRAFVKDLIQARHDLKLFVVREVQKAVLSDKLEDSGWVGDQKRVLRVLLEDKTQALLLGILITLGGSFGGFILHRLLDLWLVEEH